MPSVGLGATYEVGEGRAFGTPDAVPWESLEAGDTVLIHWRAAPYLSKWVLCREGTANAPITIRGVPGPGGELPVIDGRGATTRSALNYWGRERSVLKIGGASVPTDATPRHIVGQMVHYGGDSGNEAAYRKGTLFFHHNTLVSTRTDRTTVFRLSTNDESCDCRNNVVYTEADGNTLSWLDVSGQLVLSHNWSKPGSVVSFGAFTGVVTHGGPGVTGTGPRFLDVAGQNFRLGPGSDCIDAGTNLSPAVLPEHAAVRQFTRNLAGEARRLDAAPDLGAYEYSPYEAWRHEHFGPGAETASAAADLADPDGDEVVNLNEYALGLDPWVGSTLGLPMGMLLGQGTESRLGIRFERRLPVSELVYTVQVSEDLVEWRDGVSYSDAATVTEVGMTTEWSAGPPTVVSLKEPMTAAGRRFLRVAIRRAGL